MAQIPKESVEQVLNATDIVELISTYLPLKRAGSQFKGLCPFHNEKSPSFHVSPTRQFFHCFGCGKSGDAIAFIRDYENLPFVEAVQRLAARSGIVIQEEVVDVTELRRRRSRGRLLDLMREAAEFMHLQLLKSGAAGHAREYLKSRGYGQEMAKSWTVGWMPEDSREFLAWAKQRQYSGRELVDSGMCYLREEGNANSGLRVRFRDRLMFCVRNEVGDVVAFSGRQLREDPNSGKYVNSPGTAIFNKSRVLFALDRAKRMILKERSALLCEGQLDVIRCHEAGLEFAIAPLGTSFTKDHARLLKRYTQHVVACYDSDSAGVKASERLFKELAPEGISMRVVCLPTGADPDSYLKTHTVEDFRKCLQDAKEFFDFKLEYARAQGGLATAAGRSTALSECAEMLASMSDVSAMENSINLVVTQLQTSVQSLRNEIVKIKAKGKVKRAEDEEGVREVVQATRVHRVVLFLCRLALCSMQVQEQLLEQFAFLYDASQWVEGVPVLEKILSERPNPDSPGSINVFFASLPLADRMALSVESMMESPPEDVMQAMAETMDLLGVVVLQKKDAAIKAALKQPGLDAARMMALLEEAKEIQSLMAGIGQRIEYDDELPASTFKPKEPEWKRRFRK